MIKEEIETVEKTSPNLVMKQTEQLKHIFPQVFSEGKIDFVKLRTALGDMVDDQPERYSFTWAGKRNATQLLQTPSFATLIPAEDESVNFGTTQNLFLEGDNLEILKLLYKSYSGRVKMIYIDPPYNTGNDFVYPDNFSNPLSTYLEITGQKDANGDLLTSNPETSGRYHSSWLSMIYPRLYLARQLLTEDGLIFVSIDDHEVFNLRMLMNEIFGEENFVESFVWKKSYGGGAKEKFALTQHEYILLYSRNKELLHELWLPPNPEAEQRYYKYRDEKFETRGGYRLNPLEATASMDSRPNLRFPIKLEDGTEVWPQKQWWWNKERVEQALKNNELVFNRSNGKITVSYKQYLYDEHGEERKANPYSVIDKIYTQQGTKDLRDLFNGELPLQFPKPVNLIKQLIQAGTTSEDDIIIDFFAGSCTTAQAVLELNREENKNRRFIMVQLPEATDNTEFPTIAEIGKERIRRVIASMKSDDEGKLELSTREKPEDLGFRVFNLAPSNYKQWQSADSTDAEAYTKQLTFFTDPLVEGWSPDRVIWEVAIKEGYGLNASVKHLEEIKGNTIWQVTDPDKGQSFLICLDNTLHPSTLSALPLTKDHIFVCLNKALDDTLAANLALQCRLKKI